MGSSSKTTHSYIHEEDKVRAAKINKEKEILLAKINQENIELQHKSELELMQANANFQLDIMKAKEQGFTRVMKSLQEMMREWNIISEQRIAFVNNSKHDVAVKINKLYTELLNKVEDDSFDFHLNKQPQLLNQLENFKETDSYESYRNNIDTYVANFIDDKKELTKNYRNQLSHLIQSSTNSIDQINSEIHQIVNNRVESLTKTLQSDVDFQKVIETKEDKTKMLTS
jgi:uncharacterized membrane-anchored protein YhcB (DUF1043 family)